MIKRNFGLFTVQEIGADGTFMMPFWNFLTFATAKSYKGVYELLILRLPFIRWRKEVPCFSGCQAGYKVRWAFPIFMWYKDPEDPRWKFRSVDWSAEWR